MSRPKVRHLIAVVIAFALAATLIACGGDEDSGAEDGTTIGFLYVGPRDDFGYNQAAFAGSQAVAEAFPDAEILQAENVPETAEAERVMENMISDGATIIFPTSFGHLEPALNVARKYPDVTFLHQGGLDTSENLGTYFGTIWQAQYAAGVAAGMATESNRLGFVGGFPIAQVLLNVNAYELGARSVNPDATTSIVFTSNWCDPAKQAAATNSLIDQGADVITQHQDCTNTVIETAARRGAKVTGYHFDASRVAPEAWLTGAAWNWGPLYVDAVRTIEAGGFEGSKYDGRYRSGLGEAVQLTPFGGAATPEIRERVEAAAAEIRSGELEPFTGPIRDQSGRVRIPGPQPSVEELEETDYLVEGVSGEIPG